MTQAVVVAFQGSEKRLAYLWTNDGDKALFIGDRVLVPGNAFCPEERWGTVVEYGTGGYNGPLALILGRAT